MYRNEFRGNANHNRRTFKRHWQKYIIYNTIKYETFNFDDYILGALKIDHKKTLLIKGSELIKIKNTEKTLNTCLSCNRWFLNYPKDFKILSSLDYCCLRCFNLRDKTFTCFICKKQCKNGVSNAFVHNININSYELQHFCSSECISKQIKTQNKSKGEHTKEE